MYSNILATVARHISLSSEEQDYFIKILDEKLVFKKEFLLNQGQGCSNIFYVNSGILRAYHLNKEGKESTVMFAIADWWVTDMSCFLNELPALLSIQAVEDCQLLRLSKHRLEELYEAVPKFEKYFRVIMQNAYVREQSRNIENLSLPAKDRYENFVSKYPQVANNVTQKQIASYLGVTPEFLSSIRAKRGTG